MRWGCAVVLHAYAQEWILFPLDHITVGMFARSLQMQAISMDTSVSVSLDMSVDMSTSVTIVRDAIVSHSF